MTDQNTQQSQRLELIGAVATGVAHDLNNQLTVILNHLDFAMHELPASAPGRQNLADVQRAAMRCTEITRTLLGFGARGTARPERLDLAPLLHETARLLRRVIPTTVQIALAIDPSLDAIVADATQIQQVLINLSINARDAMPQGGLLAIRAENGAGSVILTVEDNGCGMSAEVREHIFEPFFTTKEEGAGTGLGLAMVSSIIESHGGSVEVETRPAEGTTFRLVLPAAPRPAGAGDSGCVLVADDDDLVRDVAATALARKGYRVIQARDGEEAVRLFRAHGHEIDLLFLDHTMPRMTGMQALSRIHAIRPDAKALLTSGYEVPVEGGFLRKPYRADELTRKVGEMMKE